MEKSKRAWLIIVSAIILTFGMVVPQQVSAASEASKKPKATNVQYVTDTSGKKTGIKSFTISPFTYANLSQNTSINPNRDSTMKLDDAALLRIAKQDIFPKWGVIAEGVFRDQASQLVTIEGSGMMSSDTSAKNSFDRHFSTDKVSNGYTYDWAVKDLAAYLGSGETKHQGKTCWDEVRVTGPTQIGSLDGARTLMGQELRNCSDDNDLTKDDFLGNSYQKNEDKRRLPDLEDDKSGEGFANIVTCVNRAGASGDYDYVSFGVAVYGFDITPVAAENLKYVEAADDEYQVGSDKKSGQDILMGLAGNVDKTGISFQNDRESGTTTYIRNKTTQEVTQSSGLENSITEESTIGTDDTFEWGMEQEIGLEINMGGFGGGIIGAAADGISAPCMFPRATLSMSNSWHELWSTTKSTSETKSATKTKTTNTEVTLPGHTIAVVNQSLENTKTTENYQQPVIVSYKVAIFAMSGDYFNGASGGITNSRYDKQWMSVIFDGSDDVYTSGCKALGSLYNRGVVNRDTNGYDGAKGKYRTWCDKSAWSSSSKINWNSISSTLSGDNRASHRIELSTGKKATTVSDLATELPLLEKAQMLTSKRESTTSSVDQIIPLYPLASVSMKSGSKEYELVPRGQQSGDESNILHLDPIKVEGFDNGGAEFYEFDEAWGRWELLDEDGNMIEDGSDNDESAADGEVRSGLVRLITDDRLDSQRIEVARDGSDSSAEEQHYIQWKLKKGTGEDGSRIVSNESLNRSEEDGGPYMTDTEKEAVSTPSIKITVNNRESDIVNLEVDGTYKGPWNEEINLGHVLSASALDQSGRIRGVPIYWESKGESGITVNENGNTVFTKKGSYKVRPYGYNTEDKKIIPKDKNGDPIWLDVTAQDKAEISDIVINKPDMDEAETELTEGRTSIGFDLTSYTRFYDQYGDKWEGEVPEVRYSVTPNNHAIVDREGILTITRAGSYIVTAKAYDQDGNDTGIVIKPIRIDVTEKDRLASITFDEPAISKNERTLRSRDDYVVIKDLHSLIHYTDQNGNEWTGKKPSISFSLRDAGDAAEIKGGNFYAYEPGRYTIYANAAEYSIDPVSIVILEDSSLVLKSVDPGRQYLYSEDDQIEIELERYIDATNTFDGKWKGEVPELNFTLDKPAEGTSITSRTVYEDEEDYDGEDRHFFNTNVPGEYTIHVAPKKASEYAGQIDDINIRVVKGRKLARIEFDNIEEVLSLDDLTVNTYESEYPQIDLKSHLRYYDGFGDEIDPVKDHVRIPDCRFELIDSSEYEPDEYDLEDGVLTSYQADMYFIRASINVTNNDPHGEDASEDTILEDLTSIITFDAEWLHNFGEWETGGQPTCTEEGYRTKKCLGHDTDEDGTIDEQCSYEITDPVPAYGHDWAGDDGVAEYEVVSEGSRTYLAVRCQKCGEVNRDTISGYANTYSGSEQHKPVYKEGEEATCTEPGTVICWYRAVNGQMTQTELRVPATGHSWNSDFTEKEPATCKKTGTEVIKCKCSGCDAEREGSEYQRIIPRKSHIPDKNGWRYDIIVEEDGTETEARETCEDYGWKVTECTLCGESQYELIPPTGHTWEAPTYKWEPGFASVTATRVCKNDEGHSQTETAKTTASVTKKPTYTDMGQTTYTARFQNSAFQTQTRTETDIPRLNRISIANAAVTGIVSKVYTGKSITQSPVVKLNGKTLTSGTDYTLTYKNNINVGKATVTITGRNAYTGTIARIYWIRPKAPVITKSTVGVRTFTVFWARQPVQITGYQIQYSTTRGFTSGNKIITIANRNQASRVVSGLTSGKVYYLRMRTYHNVGGTYYYSLWGPSRSARPQ